MPAQPLKGHPPHGERLQSRRSSPPGRGTALQPRSEGEIFDNQGYWLRAVPARVAVRNDERQRNRSSPRSIRSWQLKSIRIGIGVQKEGWVRSGSWNDQKRLSI